MDYIPSAAEVRALGGEYGGIMDFMACCFLAVLLVPPRLVRLSLIVLGACAILLGSYAVPAFFWEAAGRSASLTVNSTFSTSYAAVMRDIAVSLYVVIRIWGREGGFSAVLKHWENAKDAIIALVTSFLLVFGYHLFIVLPTFWESDSPIAFHALPPSPGAYQKTDPNVTPKVQPIDLFMEFSMARGSISPSFWFVNKSDRAAKQVHWIITLWDVRFPDQTNSLSIRVYPIDWIKGGQETGPVSIFDQVTITQLKLGDTLIGTAAIDCLSCVPRSWVLYMTLGGSGWYGETDKRWKGQAIVPTGNSKAAMETYFKNAPSIIPEKGRIRMSQQ